MSKQRSDGDGGWAAFQNDRGPGGVLVQGGAPAALVDGPGLVDGVELVDGAKPVASGKAPDPAEPAWLAADPAAGTMPDDAWLAALFAEGEALFGERDWRGDPAAPSGPELCCTASCQPPAAVVLSGLGGLLAHDQADGQLGGLPGVVSTTGPSVHVLPGGPSNRPSGSGSGSGSESDSGSDAMVSQGPVALWPVEMLREALAGAPGAELARVVAEYTGLGAAPRGAAGTGIAVGRAAGPVVEAASEPAAVSTARPPGSSTVGPQAVPGAGRLAGSHAGPAADEAGSVGAEAGSAALAALSDDVLGELVAACARLQSWAAGVQAQAVAERAARETHPLAHDSLVGQVTAELAITQAEGSEVVVRAESGAQHPTVISALVSGRIDVRKAHTLLRSAAQLTVAERAEAIARYLPQAPYRTWRWLRNRLLAFAKARHGAEETARAAALDRNVQLDRAENDMGWLSAYLPAVDAAAVWGVVDDMAHQLRYTAGEERTLGQLRADCLTGIVTGRLLPADRFAVTATDETSRTNATSADISMSTKVSTSADTGTAVAEDGACTCGGRAPVVHETVVRVVPTRPVVRVTVPASTLLGLDDAPAELDGFGPVPADVARLLAEDATWRRLVTDPVTGVLVDYSSQAYTPGKVLRAAVEARDGTCTFIGCDTPATTCDLDHIEPFDHRWRERAWAAGKNRRGQTNAGNLHALCRRHHLLKTHAGWGVERDPVTGITTWTTPAGRTHTRRPTVLDTRVDLDEVDPGTSNDLTMRALTGRRLPRAYTTAAPTAAATDPSGPGMPPF